MIKSNKLSKFNEIKHGFFNRKGGESKGIYKSLNCGMGSLDKNKNVINNIKIVCKKIGVNQKNLITLKQVHSNKFYFIEKNKLNKNKLKGDALITNLKNIALGILTADCAPIFIYDNKKKNYIRYTRWMERCL